MTHGNYNNSTSGKAPLSTLLAALHAQKAPFQCKQAQTPPIEFSFRVGGDLEKKRLAGAARREVKVKQKITARTERDCRKPKVKTHRREQKCSSIKKWNLLSRFLFLFLFVR